MKNIGYIWFVICVFLIALCFGFAYEKVYNKYDIENVDVVLQVDTNENYLYARDNGLDIAKLYYDGEDITHKNERGFSIGYSYNRERNVVIVYLMQKKHETRRLEFQLN